MKKRGNDGFGLDDLSALAVKRAKGRGKLEGRMTRWPCDSISKPQVFFRVERLAVLSFLRVPSHNSPGINYSRYAHLASPLAMGAQAPPAAKWSNRGWQVVYRFNVISIHRAVDRDDHGVINRYDHRYDLVLLFEVERGVTPACGKVESLLVEPTHQFRRGRPLRDVAKRRS